MDYFEIKISYFRKDFNTISFSDTNSNFKKATLYENFFIKVEKRDECRNINFNERVP